MSWTPLLDDFLAFGEHLVASRDVDPLYPILTHLTEGYSTEDKIQYCMWYMVYYNLVSAMRAGGDQLDLRTAKYPTGIERRGFRDGIKMVYHWNSLLNAVHDHDSWFSWATQGWHNDDPVHNWHRAEVTIMDVYGNGRWAAYKARELFQKVCGLNIIPQDMGHKSSTSPRKGLMLLYKGLPKGEAQRTIEILDEVSWELYAKCPWASDLAEVETACCNFKAFVDGRYYVGHDIDELHSVALKAPLDIRVQILDARIATLPHEYLGELHDWTGVQKDRKGAYKRGEGIWVR